MGDDFLRQLLVDTFTQSGFLLHHFAGGVGVFVLQALHVDFAFDQRLLEDRLHLFENEIGITGHVHGQVFDFKTAFATQVETALQFFAGVFEGIGDFVFVQLGHHVERGHGISPD